MRRKQQQLGVLGTISTFAYRRRETKKYLCRGGRSQVNKSVPLQTWSGPEGSRKLRFPDFMTTAQEGGKVVSLTHRSLLPPGNPPGTHFCQRLSAIGRIMSMKNSNDTIWNRTSYIPICSAAPYCATAVPQKCNQYD